MGRWLDLKDVDHTTRVMKTPGPENRKQRHCLSRKGSKTKDKGTAFTEKEAIT